MMDPLKEMFSKAFYRNFTDTFRKSYPAFRADDFYKDVTKDLATLELNQRLRNTTVQLRKYLPDDYKKAVDILTKTAPLLKTGYTALVLPDFVGQYGKEQFDISMAALKYFTRFGSSEFAIRAFLKTDLQKTLKVMYRWAEDDNYHVRRLASEGSRPRLPWGFALPEIMNNPALTQPILEQLKTDEQLYVKKSVANHLNDFSKVQTAYLLKLVGSWNISNEHTRWIVKHACRTLIKSGHPQTLSFFSFEKNVKVKMSDTKLNAKKLMLGETLLFSFDITSEKSAEQKLVIDYAISYARPDSRTSRKVFKLKEIVLAPGKTISISKKQLFRNLTTRTHYAGKHLLEIIINGKVMSAASFQLQVPETA